MTAKAGATRGEKIQGNGATFTALDWFPHANRKGAVVVVLRWQGECDLCGARWEATSAASKAQKPKPYTCPECR